MQKQLGAAYFSWRQRKLSCFDFLAELASILHGHPHISAQPVSLPQERKMESRNRRQFIRVNVQQEAVLDFSAQKCVCSVSNLSLGGMFVKGGGKRPGETCAIHLKRSAPGAEIKAAGTVVWVSEDGMALKFSSMTIDSFLFLQTMLLHEADGSFAPADEPVSGIGFAQDDALMVYC
jgi:hypothetical protein